MVCKAAELPWIHVQLPGHLDLRMTEVVPLSNVYPNLQILWNPFLRHGCAPYRNLILCRQCGIIGPCIVDNGKASLSGIESIPRLSSSSTVIERDQYQERVLA